MLNYKLKITDKDNDGCIVEDYNVSDHLKQLLNKLDQESLERLFERDAYKVFEEKPKILKLELERSHRNT